MTKAITTGLIGLVLLGWAGPMSAQPVSPYADQQSREITTRSNWQANSSFPPSSASVWNYPRRV